MNLNDAQIAQVKAWIEDGLKLSEIQSKLTSELGIRLTYMETRFLIDDLQLRPKDTPEPEAVSEPPADIPHSDAKPGDAQVPLEEPISEDFLDPTAENIKEPGDVSVSVDRVTRAGALVSGGVQFSDGKKADWYLDQFGHFRIAPQEEGYNPSQADLMLFQGELQSELSKLGY